MRLLISDPKNWRFKKYALQVGVLSLVTVVLWVAFELQQTYSTSTVPLDVEKHLEPLVPSLDTETLQSLNDRYVPPETFTVEVLVDEADIVVEEEEEEFEASPSASETFPLDESGF